MTSPTSSRGTAGTDRRRTAFTLIELILVMALLVIGFGITFPVLSRFFRGRVLDSEARRLLSLTRYGRNRAVTEGMPMVLWIDGRDGSYGLEAAPGYLEDDDHALEYRLDNDLEIEVSAPPATVFPVLGSTTLQVEGTGRRTVKGLPAIRFQPDGFIDDASPEYVEIREGKDDTVWLVQTTNHVAFELSDEPPVLQRRR